MAFGQSFPNFNDAIDPLDLGLGQVFEHLDTFSNHRKPISLSFLTNEFPNQEFINIDVFYQKSDQHSLLRLGSNRIKCNPLFVMTEGWGTTYIKVSDDQCAVWKIIYHDHERTDTMPLFRDCLF